MWISVGSTRLLTRMPNDTQSAAVASGLRILSVAELLRSVRDALERRFPLAWVRGELSNFRAPSGHLYFTLKDAAAQVDCVMFRSRAATLDWEPREGMQVELRALPTLYEPRGRFQLTVEGMRRAGWAPCTSGFCVSRRARRRRIVRPGSQACPAAPPRCIGIITSLAAAALRDVLTTLSRRNAAIEVIGPVPADEGAADHHHHARPCQPACRVRRASSGARRRLDRGSLAVQRGGGRARNSRVPYSRSGRRRPQADFTIADFAADQRAPTPAAAELASPARAGSLPGSPIACAVSREMLRNIQYASQRLDGSTKRLVHPAARLRATSSFQLKARLVAPRASRASLPGASPRSSRATLASVDPTAVLARGYSITSDAHGLVVRRAAHHPSGRAHHHATRRGSIESEVRKV